MLRAGICGAGGRMGKMVMNVLLERGHRIGAAFEAESAPDIGKDAGTVIYKQNLNVTINPINKNDIVNVDGFIDFSTPKSLLKLLGIIKDVKKPLVIGTTGFTDKEIKRISDASKYIPLLFSPNMSVGVNLLFRLTEIASELLGKDYDIDVFEAHHRFKVDAPSGTAKRLLEIIKDKAPALKKASLMYDRTKKSSKRSSKEIGVQVLRGGDIVGDHTVYFAGIGERIELTHRASSREIFAKGAVVGLEYLISRKPGLYDMSDVLGL
jgi:4-hydroxy-tetrahydrodipicolinate reductase